MSRLGIEIGADALRAVRIERGELRTFEVEWDPDVPAPAVAAVLDAFGRARAVGAAIGPGLLRVRRLALPPLSLGERRRALELEPDRHFATADPLAFSLPGNADLAFAVPRERAEAWLDALAGLGPVTRLEPAAVATARALGAAGAPADADVLRNGLDGGVAWSAVRGGRLRAARHIHGDLPTALADPEIAAGDWPRLLDPWPDPEQSAVLGDALARAAPLPAPHGLPPRFLAAWGAALDLERGWEEGFVTESLQRDLMLRRIIRTAGAVAALIAGLLFFTGSLEAYRERVEGRLGERIAALEERAAPARALQAEVASLERSIAAIEGARAGQTDRLATLRALAAVLPADTWLRSVSAAGAEWHIEGTGGDAAALVPLLESHPAFEGVRFTSATSRIQRDDGSYDNFALAFRTTGPAERP